MNQTLRTPALVCGLLLAGVSAFAMGRIVEPMPVSLQKLADIEYEAGDEIPDEILAYDGEEVEISGYMRNGTTEGETWFDLTNDACGCGTSKLQHFVRVTLEEGSTSFTPDELVLTGRFEVSEKEDEDGFVESIYRLEIKSLDDEAGPAPSVN
ncbi:MAG: hypothetical protein ACI9F9_002429 [Candidatus Paceibacteria bacterium]|jgi:hypothetical protein